MEMAKLREPLFLQPVFQERIWGGDKLKSEFGYEIPSAKTGECWAISAHQNGMCEIKNGRLKGQTLADVWTNHKELFGNETGTEFPLLIKILDANQDLSVQVHPDDTYAAERENGQLGKTECWYIIDCEEGAEIVYGHHAKSKEELAAMIEQGKWDELLRKVKVKRGDFFFVPSRTIHAIGAGIMILETQQSSDLTYRVYDYDRTDDEGQARELHIEPSIEVTAAPHEDATADAIVDQRSGLKSKRLKSCEYFTVYHWDLNGEANENTSGHYWLCSVLDGAGKITIDGQSYSFAKGDHFIVPTTVTTYQLAGQAELVVSHT